MSQVSEDVFHDVDLFVDDCLSREELREAIFDCGNLI